MKRQGRVAYDGLVIFRVINELMRKTELILVEGTKKGRGRLKITLIEVVKK